MSFQLQLVPAQAPLKPALHTRLGSAGGSPLAAPCSRLRPPSPHLPAADAVTVTASHGHPQIKNYPKQTVQRAPFVAALRERMEARRHSKLYYKTYK